jgi:hypothetical protein
VSQSPPQRRAHPYAQDAQELSWQKNDGSVKFTRTIYAGVFGNAKLLLAFSHWKLRTKQKARPGKRTEKPDARRGQKAVDPKDLPILRRRTSGRTSETALHEIG